MDVRDRRRWAAALLAGVIVTGLAGCSSSEESDDPYHAAVEDAARRASSAFEREVFADGRVTAEEYEEAVARYVRCANDRGVALSTMPQDGFYGYTYPQTPKADGILDRCAKGTTLLIEPIYVAVLTNPSRDDTDELIAACVVRTGLAPPGYSGAQIKAEKAAARREGRGIDFPFDEDDPRFGACVADPLRARASAGPTR